MLVSSFMIYRCGGILITHFTMRVGFDYQTFLMHYALAKASPPLSTVQQPKACFQLHLCFCLLHHKSVTTAFDRLVGIGSGFSNLTVILAFLVW
jgi:hypothetical protein